MQHFISALLALCLVSGCAVNPVTGRSDLNMYSLAQQKQIGAQHYSPMKQSQGGEITADPQLSAYVNQVGQRIAAVSDLPLEYEFVVLNNGVPNAWALPGGKIAINRGLMLELQNEAELAAVLGHEVVHAAAAHGAQAMTRGNLMQGALVIGAIASSNNQYSDYIVGASMLGATLITTRYGREAERESDEFGIHYMVRAGYEPQAAVSLQQTFVRLSEGRDSGGWLEGLFASHPPSQERVENNQALVNQLRPTLEGRDLELGEVRYQQATTWIRQNKAAYDLMDEAEKAIADNDLETAYSKLDQAIRLVPQEPRFLGLQGDVLHYQRRYRAAIERYDAAIAMDSNYFDYYLGRGVSYARLNQNNLAKADLERSSSLLPTAIAQNELGKLALAAGQRNQAKDYFRTAAAAQGAVGQEAQAAYIGLDVIDNPAEYVQVQSYADQNGRVLVRVGNRSPVTLRNIRVDVAAVIGGNVQRRSVQVNNLSSGAQTDVASGLAFPRGSTPTPDMMNAVVAAANP
jgi:beta-barrel assembly-enhancing protease